MSVFESERRQSSYNELIIYRAAGQQLGRSWAAVGQQLGSSWAAAG